MASAFGNVTSAPTQTLSWSKDAFWVTTALSAQVLAQWRFDDMQPADPSTLHREQVAPYDRWAIDFYSPRAALSSDLLVLGCMGVPVVLNGWSLYSGNKDFRSFAAETVVLSEILLLNSSLSRLFRSLRLHPRPLVYNAAVPLSERTRGEASGSFFSGHASTAFAATVYAGYVYGRDGVGAVSGPRVWAGGMGAASAVALLRVAAGKHFPSDIVAGAAAGSAIAYLLAKLHDQKPGREVTGRAGGIGERIEMGVTSLGQGIRVSLKF